MPRVNVNNGKSIIEAEQGETLLSCLRRSGLRGEFTCDGRGICGKCRLAASGDLSEPDSAELERLEGMPAGFRLACMARVLGNVSVTLSDTWTHLQTAPDQARREVPLDSSLRRIVLPTSNGASGPFSEVLPYRISDPTVLARIAQWAESRKETSGIVFENDLLEIRFDRGPMLGASVDIGTTSLSLSLFDLESGKLLGSSSALNPQTAYGGDVITRINFCRQNPDGVSTLRSVLTEQLRIMLDEALGECLSRDQVYFMTAAGNTTMLHILAGVSPFSLALAPFRPTFLKPFIIEGDRSGLDIAPSGRFMLLPGASAYVGADIVAGLAAIDYRSCPNGTLFIDMGTNGEIVLIEDSDRLLGTSCAMGPALEGMNIACGCRAVPGAIDSFSLAGDMSLNFTTIGGLPPIGICGSGLIDLMAALLSAGLIAPGGAFNPNGDERLAKNLKGDRFHISDNVFLSQKDIRQVQLAKSAVLTGILTLLGEAGRSVSDLDRIIVAGSFGYHLNPENLKRMGLLPGDFEGKISFVGNSSLSGASLALLNRGIMRDMESTASRVRVVELGSHPGFSKNFISNLDFAPVREAVAGAVTCRKSGD